jgi:hypothetical protein
VAPEGCHAFDEEPSALMLEPSVAVPEAVVLASAEP